MTEASERKPLPPMFRHVSGFIAVGAVMLYGLGILKTVGQLRASDLDPSNGLAQIPADRHLRNGVAILADPLVIGVLLFNAIAYYNLARRFGDKGIAPLPLDFKIALWLSVVLLFVVALFGAWPVVFVPMAVAALTGLCLNLAGDKASPTKRMRILRNLSYGTAAVLLVFLAFSTYQYASPLPEARITLADGTVRGPLITNSDGVIVVGDERAKTLYQQIPLSQITRIQVIKTSRDKEPSILELFGLK